MGGRDDAAERAIRAEGRGRRADRPNLAAPRLRRDPAGCDLARLRCVISRDLAQISRDLAQSGEAAADERDAGAAWLGLGSGLRLKLGLGARVRVRVRVGTLAFVRPAEWEHATHAKQLVRVVTEVGRLVRGLGSD